MNDEEQVPILGQSNCCCTLLFCSARIFNAYERVEKDLTRHLKSDPVLAYIAGRLPESHTKRWPR